MFTGSDPVDISAPGGLGGDGGAAITPQGSAPALPATISESTRWQAVSALICQFSIASARQNLKTRALYPVAILYMVREIVCIADFPHRKLGGRRHGRLRRTVDRQ